MQRTSFASSLARILTFGVTLTIALVPFHAFLTVWLSQFLGHYTELRLWKEFLLLCMVIVSTTLLSIDRDLRDRFLHMRVVWLIALFGTVQLVWGLISYFQHQVTLEALGYGWIVDCRFLLFFLLTLLAGMTLRWSDMQWQRLVFWPAAAVVIIGLLQYFILPYDVLRHFGYSATTIFPYEDINHNTHYIRVMSTLRGANPLGAYLVAVLSLIAGVVCATWKRSSEIIRTRWPLIALGLLGLAILIVTFSRGAWLGLVVSIVALLALYFRQLPRRAVWAGCGVFLVIIAAVLMLQHNRVFQNVFWHTETDSTITLTSNAGHVSAFQQGVHDVVHEPLGRGPGTAGPASAYNTSHPTRIAENFFLQIGQETGWFGLALFLSVNVLVGRMLWQQRTNPLALGLFAGLLGLSVVNFFSHAWADDTLAYLWWGLAGIAFARTSAVEPTDIIHS